jgi:hypothetical protein
MNLTITKHVLRKNIMGMRCDKAKANSIIIKDTGISASKYAAVG